MTTVEKVPAILAKIARIQAEVGAIPKNGKGPAQKGGFAYIRAEDILDKVHSLLVQEGVIVLPTIEYSKHQVEFVNNRAMVNATVTARYRFVAVEDGSSVDVVAVGEGSDIGSDTATRKAATQALKISHLHTFTIPNSEFDDEGYEPEDKQAKTAAPTKAQQAIAKASPVNAEVSKLQGRVREYANNGVGADQLKALGELVTKELGKTAYDKADVDILKGMVARLEAGEVG